MRLWHYKLIPVLPNKMLVSQWRECIAIKRQWEKGTLKHRLVSYVMDYDRGYFLNYTTMIVEEIANRGINYNNKLYKEILKFYEKQKLKPLEILPNIIFKSNIYKEHNDRYLKQCYYNLQEKYDCGIITEKEWEKIEDLFKEEI